jgi:hypothetical protein
LYVTVVVTLCVIVTSCVIGSACDGTILKIFDVAFVTDGAFAAAAAPVTVVDASEIVIESGDAFPLMISRNAPTEPSNADAIVSDAATGAPVVVVPARVGVVAVSAPIV